MTVSRRPFGASAWTTAWLGPPVDGASVSVESSYWPRPLPPTERPRRQRVLLAAGLDLVAMGVEVRGVKVMMYADYANAASLLFDVDPRGAILGDGPFRVYLLSDQRYSVRAIAANGLVQWWGGVVVVR